MSNQSFKHVFPIFSFTSSSKDFTFSVQLEENKNAAQNSLYYVNVMEVPFLLGGATAPPDSDFYLPITIVFCSLSNSIRMGIVR